MSRAQVEKSRSKGGTVDAEVIRVEVVGLKGAEMDDAEVFLGFWVWYQCSALKRPRIIRFLLREHSQKLRARTQRAVQRIFARTQSRATRHTVFMSVDKRA